MKDKNNASFAWGVGMLRTLLAMKLIDEEEYKRIVEIHAKHYGVKIAV